MNNRYWLLMLVVAGAVLRVGLWACYEPTAYPDTGTYVDAAKDLLAGDLSRGEGRRTPGYPLLIALAGLAPQKIVVMQMAAGMLISVLLFHVTILMSGRPGFAFAVGMTYNLNLQQLFFEATLLSETISTLGVVAVVAVMLHAFHRLREDRPAFGMLVLLGLLAGVAVLIRPQFVFLPLLLPALVACAFARPQFHVWRALKRASLTALPALILVLAWCTVIYLKVGFFTLSTQSGFGLVNHSVAFIELAPDRYATIRDILLKHRATKFAEQGHYGNTIWLALPEIRVATGMSLPEASREVQRMSFELFMRHPLRYGAGVARAWVDFWTVPQIWQLDRVTPGWLRPALDAAWWVEHKLLRLTNVAFVALAFAALISRRARQRMQWDLDMTGISAIILLSSVIQALADYGASSRYEVTVQALVVLVVLEAWRRALDARTRPALRKGRTSVFAARRPPA